MSGAASAQLSADETRNAARNLAGDAKTAFDRGDFERARDLFHRAYALVPAPTIALFEARALAKLNRLVDAEEAYTRAARTNLDAESSEAFRRAVTEAEDELVPLRPRIPRLLIIATGEGAGEPDLALKLDGNLIPAALRGVEIPVDPGRHTLAAVVPGVSPIEVQLELVEKQQKRLEISVPAARREAASLVPGPRVAPPSREQPHEPPAPAAEPTHWQTPAAIVAGGVGVAGLATGVIAGWMATSRHADATRECPEGACAPDSSGWQDAQSFRTLRTVSSVGYVVGVVGVAGGITLLLTAPKARPARAMALDVGAGVLRLKGSF
jgi:hypothetical protein